MEATQPVSKKKKICGHRDEPCGPPCCLDEATEGFNLFHNIGLLDCVVYAVVVDQQDAKNGQRHNGKFHAFRALCL